MNSIWKIYWISAVFLFLLRQFFLSTIWSVCNSFRVLLWHNIIKYNNASWSAFIYKFEQTAWCCLWVGCKRDGQWGQSMRKAGPDNNRASERDRERKKLQNDKKQTELCSTLINSIHLIKIMIIENKSFVLLIWILRLANTTILQSVAFWLWLSLSVVAFQVGAESASFIISIQEKFDNQQNESGFVWCLKLGEIEIS
jgi:hypothetical protein